MFSILSFFLFTVSNGLQRFAEQPKYAEVNPGEDALLTCKIFDKRGSCSWQKDNKVMLFYFLLNRCDYMKFCGSLEPRRGFQRIAFYYLWVFVTNIESFRLDLWISQAYFTENANFMEFESFNKSLAYYRLVAANIYTTGLISCIHSLCTMYNRSKYHSVWQN